MLLRNELVSFLDNLLQPSAYEDTTFNGLQVEGCEKIEKVGFAVDSSMDVFRAAFESGCDFLVVHHGLIWGSLKNVASINRERLKLLLQNEMNLYVSHLPLDFHPEIGNNISILRVLGMRKADFLPELGIAGYVNEPLTVDELLNSIKLKINPESHSISFFCGPQNIFFVSTGAISRGIVEKIHNTGIKTIITGEANGESTFYYLLKEFEMNIIFAGHYHTEVFGLLELKRLIEKSFEGKIETIFIDLPH
ncbi:MAG: Nif3-like dinuclear metal center hexameric protein [Brevinematia bacterium]